MSGVRRPSRARGSRGGVAARWGRGLRPRACSARARCAGVRSLVAASLIVVLASIPFATGAGADPLAAYRPLPGTDRGAAVLASARAAIERYFDPTATRDTLAFDWPGDPCGLYLVLVRGSSTRACVGSLTPLGGTLGESLERLAAQVVAADARRDPVRREELPALRVLVAFVSAGEPIADPMRIRPLREGLLVRGSRGDVAFLPGEARTVSWALREARRAGVLDRADNAAYLRFDAVVLKEGPRPLATGPPSAPGEDAHVSP